MSEPPSNDEIRRQADAPPARRCRNCSAVLLGQYCGDCGQREKNRMVSLWELLREFIGDLLDFDSRLWRSLVPLLLRPGRLTRDYLAGRRVHYTPPLRLYLVISVLFFFVATFGNDESSLQINEDEGVIISGDFSTGDSETDAPDALNSKSFCSRDDFTTDIALLNLPVVQERIRRACENIENDNGRLFLGHLIDNIPAMLFAFLPLIALVMKGLYLGSRRYYVEHLLFFVHYHSFVFLALTGLILLSRTEDHVPGMNWVAGLATFAYIVYAPVYLFKGMRLVYGQGKLVTFLKFAVLQAAYFACLLLTFLLGALFTALFQ